MMVSEMRETIQNPNDMTDYALAVFTVLSSAHTGLDSSEDFTGVVVVGKCDDVRLAAIWRGAATIADLTGRLLARAMESLPDSERKLEYFTLAFDFHRVTVVNESVTSDVRQIEG